MTCGSNPEDDEDRAKDDAPDADSRCLGRRRLALGALGASLGSRALSPQTEPARALVDEANATRVFDAASRSVVSLAVYDPNGTSGGYTPRGTGVVWAAFAEGGFVVTNFHVVKDFVLLPGAPEGAGKKDRSRNETQIANRVLRVQVPEERDGDATWYDAVIVGTQRASDIAVLRLMRPPAEKENDGTRRASSSAPERRFSPLAALPLGDDRRTAEQWLWLLTAVLEALARETEVVREVAAYVSRDAPAESKIVKEDPPEEDPLDAETLAGCAEVWRARAFVDEALLQVLAGAEA